MKISIEKSDTLNAVLSIFIEFNDYVDKVNSVIIDYQKKSDLPGFRKGKIPQGIIKKRYGKLIKIDEINKLLNDNVYKYIEDNKVNIIGGPIPLSNDTQNWDNASDYTFKYKLGLCPVINLSKNIKKTINYYKINVGKPLIDNYIKNLSHQFGNLIEVNEVKDNDLLNGEIDYIKSKKNSELNNYSKNISFSISKISSSLKNNIIGNKINNSILIDFKNDFDDLNFVCSKLGIDNKTYKNFDLKFSFKISKIQRNIPLDEDQNLYDKVLGKNYVKSKKEFRSSIGAKIQNNFDIQSDSKFYDNAMIFLIKELKLELPEQFLKEWIKFRSEKEINEKELDENINYYLKNFKIELIENEIVKLSKISFNKDEILSESKSFIRRQFESYGQLNPSDEIINKYSDEIIKNDEESKKIKESLKRKKIIKYLKKNINIKEKKITYEEFVKLIQ